MTTQPLTNVGSRPHAYGPAEWGLTLTIGIIWGSAFLWIAIGVDSLSPGLVAFGRVVLGAAALAMFPRARRRIARADWPRIAVIAVAGNAGPALLFAVAETELDSAVAGMLTSATPLVSLVIAGLLLRSMPGIAETLGIVIGFAGIVMMTVPSLQGADAAPLGASLVLLAVLGYGLTGNLIVPLQQRYGGAAVTMWALTASGILLAPVGLATAGDSEFVLGAVVAVVILGVVGTGIARSLAATLAGRAGGPRMSTTTYLIPVVAIVLGVVFRDETVAPIAIAGVAVVLAGVWLASRAVRAPAGAWTEWLPGTVVAGHGVASGRAKQDQFPGGAIALQRPVFEALGVDLSPYFAGTINVDVSPHRVDVVAPRDRLELVTWLEGYPPETFSFVDAEVRGAGRHVPALLYLPHPETKPEHHQRPGVLEILAEHVPGVAVDDPVEVRLSAAQVALS